MDADLRKARALEILLKMLEGGAYAHTPYAHKLVKDAFTMVDDLEENK